MSLLDPTVSLGSLQWQDPCKADGAPSPILPSRTFLTSLQTNKNQIHIVIKNLTLFKIPLFFERPSCLGLVV